MRPYTIRRARYAQSQWVIQIQGNGSGWKDIYAVMAERCGGRWVHRSKGYHVSRRQVLHFARGAARLYVREARHTQRTEGAPHAT